MLICSIRAIIIPWKCVDICFAQFRIYVDPPFNVLWIIHFNFHSLHFFPLFRTMLACFIISQHQFYLIPSWILGISIASVVRSNWTRSAHCIINSAHIFHLYWLVLSASSSLYISPIFHLRSLPMLCYKGHINSIASPTKLCQKVRGQFPPNCFNFKTDDSIQCRLNSTN